MKELTMVSQTNLKQWESGCKRRWFAMWIEGVVPFYPSLSVDIGHYFEYKTLGAGATDEKIVDLPRKRNGEKTANHIRIDEQVEKFKELHDPDNPSFLGFSIIDTQVELFSKKDKRVRGTLDYVTKDNFDTKHLFDLKSTSDVLNTRTVYGWGNNDEDLDVTQAVWYVDLYEENYNFRPEFNYLIFDYSPRKGIKFVNVKVSDENIDLLDRRKNNMINEYYNFNSDFGDINEKWMETPSESECSSCPLECKSRLAKFKH